MDMKIICCLLMGVAFSVAAHFMTKKFIECRWYISLLFQGVYAFHEGFVLYHTEQWEIKMIEWGIITVLMFSLLYFGGKQKSGWKVMEYFSMVLMFKTVYATIRLCAYMPVYYPDVNQLFSKFNQVEQEMLPICIILISVSAILTYYLWSYIVLLNVRTFRIFVAVMAIMWLFVGNSYDWKYMIFSMPSVTMFLILITFYQLEKEKERERQLYYHEKLLKQMEQRDEELEKIRREVEEYYEKAGVSEGTKRYHKQILEKIDEIRGEEGR